jgi:hypothetical protein
MSFYLFFSALQPLETLPLRLLANSIAAGTGVANDVAPATIIVVCIQVGLASVDQDAVAVAISRIARSDTA